MRTPWRAVLALAVVPLLAWTVAGCKGSTYLIGTGEEIQIGQEAAAEFDSQHPVSRTSPNAVWLAGIGQRVAVAASPPDYPYSVTLVEEDVANAFALPGGPIYFYQGLIDELGQDQDKVAWIIGHEITHIRQQHAVRRIERSIGASLLIEVLLGKQETAAQIASTVAGLALLDYGRDNEFMADALGLRWARAAGYDPTAAIPVLEKFQEIQGRDPNDFEIMFMTHPGNNDRINHVKALCAQNGYIGRYYSP